MSLHDTILSVACLFCQIVLVASTAGSCPSNLLEASYTFRGTYADASGKGLSAAQGSGNNIKLKDNYVRIQKTHYVSIPNIDISTGPWVIQYDIRVTTLNQKQYLLSNSQSGNQWVFITWLEGHRSIHMKLRQSSGHEMITTSTGPNMVEVNQWHELKFIWLPDERRLTIYVDGQVKATKVAQIQSMNRELSDFAGLWTWGRQESGKQGTLDADVRDFHVCRSDGTVPTTVAPTTTTAAPTTTTAAPTTTTAAPTTTTAAPTTTTAAPTTTTAAPTTTTTAAPTTTTTAAPTTTTAALTTTTAAPTTTTAAPTTTTAAPTTTTTAPTTTAVSTTPGAAVSGPSCGASLNMPTPSGASISLTCDVVSMKVVIDDNVFPANYSTISLVGCDEDMYDVDDNTLTANFSACATNITQHDNIIELRNTVEVKVECTDDSQMIARTATYRYDLQCEFNRRLNLTNAVVVNVVDQTAQFEVTAKTNFSAVMNIYEGATYSEIKPAPVEVTAHEPIFIQVNGVYDNPLFKFVTEECYATPSADPNDPTRYMFFDEKCGLDSTFKERDQNTHNKFRFSIDAFRFIRLKNEVYFHCRLVVCKKDSTTEECTQTCSALKKRKRRAVEGAVERVVVNSGRVTYVDKSTCRNTRCGVNSHCVNIFPARCRCNNGYVFNDNTKTCSNDNILLIKGLHLDMEFRREYYNSSSTEFLMLATRVEKVLLSVMDANVINGVKVLRASPGSIIVDVQVSHTPGVTADQAFQSFVNSVLTSQSPQTVLHVKPHIKPSLDEMEAAAEEIVEADMETVVIVVVAVVVPVLLIFLIVGMVFMRRRSQQQRSHQTRKGREIEEAVAEGFDNVAVSLEDVTTTTAMASSAKPHPEY